MFIELSRLVTGPVPSTTNSKTLRVRSWIVVLYLRWPGIIIVFNLFRKNASWTKSVRIKRQYCFFFFLFLGRYFAVVTKTFLLIARLILTQQNWILIPIVCSRKYSPFIIRGVSVWSKSTTSYRSRWNVRTNVRGNRERGDRRRFTTSVIEPRKTRAASLQLECTASQLA